MYTKKSLERRLAQIADRLSEVTDAFEKSPEAGWAQPTYGSEFIERSYVVADSKDNAKKGATYECAENVIYHDAVSNVWWRETGSFD